jgi:rhodanese-related sulfurtransferase/rubrerythrin
LTFGIGIHGVLSIKTILRNTEVKKMPEEFKRLTPDEARDFINRNRQGSYVLLDVRQPAEYEEMHLPGAKLVPLGELDERLDELDRDKPVMAYCRSGKRSSAASGFLAGRGFPQVLNLEGGISAWQGEPAMGPPDAGLEYVRGGDATEILSHAWRMEHHLGGFYRGLADGLADRDLADTLEKLAAMEDRHKRSIAMLHKNLTGEELDTEPLTKGDPEALEGGITAGDFLENNPFLLDDPVSAVESAMAFESQAMDLYMRYRDEAPDPDSHKALTALAQEEKNHLRTLSRMLDKMTSGESN